MQPVGLLPVDRNVGISAQVPAFGSIVCAGSGALHPWAALVALGLLLVGGLAAYRRYTGTALVAVLGFVCVVMLSACRGSADLSDLGVGGKWDDGPRLEAGLGRYESAIGNPGGAGGDGAKGAAPAAAPPPPAASAGAFPWATVVVLVVLAGAGFLVYRRLTAKPKA
jgi:hypothetical protein